MRLHRESGVAALTPVSPPSRLRRHWEAFQPVAFLGLCPLRLPLGRIEAKLAAIGHRELAWQMDRPDAAPVEADSKPEEGAQSARSDDAHGEADDYSRESADARLQ